MSNSNHNNDVNSFGGSLGAETQYLLDGSFPSTAGLSTAELDSAYDLVAGGGGRGGAAPPGKNNGTGGSLADPSFSALMMAMGMGANGDDGYFFGGAGDGDEHPPPPMEEDFGEDDANVYIPSDYVDSPSANATGVVRNGGADATTSAPPNDSTVPASYPLRSLSSHAHHPAHANPSPAIAPAETIFDPFAAPGVVIERRRVNLAAGGGRDDVNRSRRIVHAIEDGDVDDDDNVAIGRIASPKDRTNNLQTLFSSEKPKQQQQQHFFAASEGVLELPPLDGAPTMMVRGDNGVVRWVRLCGEGAAAGESLKRNRDCIVNDKSAIGDTCLTSSHPEAAVSLTFGGYGGAGGDDDDDDDDGDATFDHYTALLQNATANGGNGLPNRVTSPTSAPTSASAAGTSSFPARTDTFADLNHLYNAISNDSSERRKKRPQIVSLDDVDLNRLTADASAAADRIRGEISARESERSRAAAAKEAAANNDKASTAVETRDGLLTSANSQMKKTRRDGEDDEEEEGEGVAAAAAQQQQQQRVAAAEQRADAALWTGKYSPKTFVDLLSDEDSNLGLLRWVKSWDPFVFRPRRFVGGGGGGESADSEQLSGARQNEADALSGFLNNSTNDDSKKKMSATPAATTKKSNAATATAVAAADVPDRPTQRIVLITGPPGAGKTTMAHIIAAHCGYEAVEVNASVDRSVTELERLIATSVSDRHFLQNATTGRGGGGAGKAADVYHQRGGGGGGGGSKRDRDGNAAFDGGDGESSSLKKKSITASLMNKPRCLIIDEMDGVLASVTSLLLRQDICRPVICLANDLYAPSLRELRSRSAPLLVYVGGGGGGFGGGGLQLNTMSTSSVALLQLPPIKPQRLLHRLQGILGRQEDEDEARHHRRLLQAMKEKAAAERLGDDSPNVAAAGASRHFGGTTTTSYGPLSSSSAPALASFGGSGGAGARRPTTAFPRRHKVPLTDLIGQPLLAELVHASNGDVRTCLNTLQFLCTSVLSSSASSAAAPSSSSNSTAAAASVSTTDLQRLFSDACKKDSTMSTWSLWTHIFLRIEKSRYTQMLEKAAAGGGGGGGAPDEHGSAEATQTAAAASTGGTTASSVPTTAAASAASDGDVYKQYLAREDAKRAAAKLEMLKAQRLARERAEEERRVLEDAARARALGGTMTETAEGAVAPKLPVASSASAASAAPPPFAFPSASAPYAAATTFATHFDPGFAFLIQHVLPLSNSASASNSAGAGGGAIGALDVELVLAGCFEQWPRQRFPDYNLAKTVFCASTFSFQDVVASLAFGGGGGSSSSSSLIALSDQFSMVTAAACFACASSLSKPDKKMGFPRTDANYRACLRNSTAVIRGYCEGGAVGLGGGDGKKESGSKEVGEGAAAAPTATAALSRARLLSSSSFALHSPAVIAAEVAPYLCRTLLPPSLLKFPHNFTDPSRNLAPADYAQWQRAAQLHAFYGLSYRAARLSAQQQGQGQGAAGGGEGGVGPAEGGESGRFGGGGGGGGGGLWVLEPSIDRFCLVGLVAGGSRQQVFQRNEFSSNNRFGSGSNKQVDGAGGYGAGGYSRASGGGGGEHPALRYTRSLFGAASASAPAAPLKLSSAFANDKEGNGCHHRYSQPLSILPPSGSAAYDTNRAQPIGGGVSPLHRLIPPPASNSAASAPVPASAYANALSAGAGGGSSSFNPNAPVVTRGLIVGRGDVRQALVGEITREGIRLARAANDSANAAAAKRERGERERGEKDAAAAALRVQQQQPQSQSHSSVAPTTATFANNGSSSGSEAVPIVSVCPLAFRPNTVAAAAASSHAAALLAAVAAAPTVVKVKKDFFGRPIVARPAPAPKEASNAGNIKVGASSTNNNTAAAAAAATDDGGDCASASGAPLSKVQSAEAAMAVRYPSRMRFVYYDGSTVGVKRAANWGDFL